MLDFTQGLVTSVLGVVFLVVKIGALVDCLTRPKAAFVAVDRRTWGFWSAILGVAALTAFMTPLGLFGLIGLVAALVYLLDVRPRIKEVTGSRR